MSTMVVNLDWRGNYMTQDELIARASKATKRVRKRWGHLTHWDVETMADQHKQAVQLIVSSDFEDHEANRIRKAIRDEFLKPTPAWKFWK